MRFDNPIYDHGFVFPDIADFPDVKNEPKYQGNGNEQSIDIMKEAIQKNDLNMFQNGYQYYMKNVDTKLFNKLNTMFQFYTNFEDNRIESDLPTNKIYEDLFENGISYLKVNVKELQDKLEQDINNLLQHQIGDHQDNLMAKQLGEYIKLVNDMFTKLGVLQGATKYNKGKQLQVKNVVLHIATPTDHNWKQFLYDCDTVTKTTNLHIDPKEDVIKAMMYLNDITLDDGPFSYVEKSNRWIYDDLQNIFGRAISTGSYCDTPQSRATVFQLPKICRVSHNFGRILLDDDPQQKMIVEKEKMFTSDKGNLCIFDPAGMHRGGICNKGTRIALQILMK